MIYPRLDKVRNGQRMSVELVNGLIKRTEYAADLLRQYKPLAGTDISIAQRYDGTTISRGAAAAESSLFRVVFGNQATIYDPFADTFTTLDGTIAGDSYVAIKGSVVAGYNNAAFPDEGIIYNGTSFVRVNFGIDDPYTRFYGTDGKTVVGEYFEPDGIYGSVFGIQCNLSGEKIQSIIWPKEPPSGTYRNQLMFLSDVYDSNIIGEVNLRNENGFQFLYSFLFNGGFTVLDSAVGQAPAFQPYKIYKDYILSYDGKIYSISAGAIIKTILYQGLPVQVFGIYENIVSCFLDVFPFTDFLYYIDRDEFEAVDYVGDIG